MKTQALLLTLFATACHDVGQCKDGSVYATLTLDGTAANADKLVIATTVNGVNATATTSHTAGVASGSLEIDFSGTYPTGAMWSVTITAYANNTIVGTGNASITSLPSGCAAVPVEIRATSAPADLSGADLTIDLAPPPDLTPGPDMYQPESDCLDGIDNNGDGKTDCEDPSCAAVVLCVPSATGGAEIGFAQSSSTCPSDYGTAEHFNQGLQVPTTCTGCTCAAKLQCKADFYFSSSASSCSSATHVGSLNIAPLVDTGDTQCVSFAAATASAIEVTLSNIGTGATCTNDSSGAKPSGTSWTTSTNFCPVSRSSATCGASSVCVPRPPASAPVCLRIPSASASCPAGFTGSSATWFGDTQLTDNRTCNCGCTASGSCAINADSIFFHVGSSGCPYSSTAGGGGLRAPDGCFPSTGITFGGWTSGTAISTIAYSGALGGAYPTGASYGCTPNGTVSGGTASEGPNGSTFCCQ